MSEARWMQGDVFEQMAKLPDGSVDLIVTSPPFLALRSYLPADHPDKHLEIGSEPTPAAFLSTLLALTREWRRILAPHGSIAIELGDTYSGSGGAGGDYDNPEGLRNGQPKFKGSALADRKNKVLNANGQRMQQGNGWPLAKSLCLIPSLYAGSLAYGRNLLDPSDTLDPWRVRNLVVWHRPNPPVGALGDKVRPSTSYVTVACDSTKRWFDLDAERGPGSPNTHARLARGVESRPANGKKADNPNNNYGSMDEVETAGAPPLDCWFDEPDSDVWTIPTQPFRGSHYATFPVALPRRLINLMCPRQVCVVCGEPRRRIVEGQRVAHDGRLLAPAEAHHDHGNGTGSTAMGERRPTTEYTTLGWTDCGHDDYRRGIVCDPFAGSGTTLAAASELGRDSIGIDLDARNLDLARERVGMFLTEAV